MNCFIFGDIMILIVFDFRLMGRKNMGKLFMVKSRKCSMSNEMERETNKISRMRFVPRIFFSFFLKFVLSFCSSKFSFCAYYLRLVGFYGFGFATR